MNLATIDRSLKTLGTVLLALAGGSAAGVIPAWLGVILGLVGGAFLWLAGSPLFDPTLVGKVPLLSRIFTTVAGLSGVVAGSSFFPQVQHLFSDGHAQKFAALITLLGGLAATLAQSPIIAGGTVGAGGAGPAKLVLAALLGLSLGVSGCAAVVSQLPNVVAYVQDAELILNTIETAMNGVWANHPDPANQKLVNESIAKVDTALDAVNRIAQGGEKVDQAQLEAAFSDFQAAFSDLMSLLGPYGITVADVPKATRTAAGGLVVPRPTLYSVVRR